MELQSSRLPTAGCMFIRLYLFSTSLGMGRLGSVKDRSLESMREKYIEKNHSLLSQFCVARRSGTAWFCVHHFLLVQKQLVTWGNRTTVFGTGYHCSYSEKQHCKLQWAETSDVLNYLQMCESVGNYRSSACGNKPRSLEWNSLPGTGLSWIWCRGSLVVVAHFWQLGGCLQSVGFASLVP